MSGSRRHILQFIAIPLLLAAVTGAYDLAQQKTPGTVKGYPNFGGDFVLQSANGPVALKDYRGKVVVLYFGYTACPDVCPTGMGQLSLALRRLSNKELADVQAFFITLDPERDKLDLLRQYAGAFHPSILGLGGTPAQIAEIARRYGVLYLKVEMPDSALGYAVDHSSRYYVIDRNGVLRTMPAHGASIEELVASLRDAFQ